MKQGAFLLTLDVFLLSFLISKGEILFCQIILLTQASTLLVLLPFLLRDETRLHLPVGRWANLLVLLAIGGLFSPFFFVSKKYWSISTVWGDEAKTLFYNYGDLVLVLAGTLVTIALLAAAVRRGGRAHD